MYLLTLTVLFALNFSVFKTIGIVQAQDSIPGMITSMEEILKNHKTQYQKDFKEYSKAPLLASSSSNFSPESILITENQALSILISTPEKYLSLMQKDQCEFYSLIANGLFRDIMGDVSSLMINKKAGNETSIHIMSDKDMLSSIGHKSCLWIKDAEALFSNENLVKTTKRFEFKIPKNTSQCTDILKDWKENKYLPFLCKIENEIFQGRRALSMMNSASADDFQTRKILNERVRRMKILEENLDPFKKNYIVQLCDNLTQFDNFCETYLEEHIFSKVKNAELPSYKGEALCENILKRKLKNKSDYDTCYQRFKKTPEICPSLMFPDAPGFYPGPSCSELSNALINDKLYFDYIDCPAMVHNDGLVTASRIIAHFKKLGFSKEKNSCFNAPMSIALQGFKDFGFAEGWPLKICYHDPIESKELCPLFVPGENDSNEHSESKVISKIIQRTKGGSSKLECHVIEKKTYKPVLLSFRHGCYILYDANNCSPANCPREVMYNKELVGDIKYLGKNEFTLGNQSFSSLNFSYQKMIEESYGLKVKSLKNLTELKFHLDLSPTTIAYGIGCAEDIKPEYFQRRFINQCNPISFIISGFKSKKDFFKLVVHLGMDNVTLPRIIKWQDIYNSIANFSDIHPNHVWSLYGVR